MRSPIADSRVPAQVDLRDRLAQRIGGTFQETSKRPISSVFLEVMAQGDCSLDALEDQLSMCIRKMQA